MKKELYIGYSLGLSRNRKYSESKLHPDQVAMEIINIAKPTDSMSEEDRLLALRDAAYEIRLIDSKKRVLEPSRSLYKPYVLDTLQFLVAEIDEIRQYGTKETYVKVTYCADNGKYYSCGVQINSADYFEETDRGLDETRPMFLIGTCVRSEYLKPAQYRYSSVTCQKEKITDEQIAKKTKMLQFAVVNYNEGSHT